MNSRIRKEKISFNRKAVIASASITRQSNTIHCLSEIDITKPRSILSEYKLKQGISLSFTGYIAKCLANTIERHPQFNSFISGSNIIYMEEIIISIMVERQLEGKSVPEPLVIKDCSHKDYYDIHLEIIEAKQKSAVAGHLGELSGNSWFNYIPTFLLKAFIRVANRSTKMGVKYGKIAITSIGMHSKSPLWFIPHGSPTILLSIGSIVNRIVEIDGSYDAREHLCITASFNHDIIDGAPGARFMDDLVEEIKSGKCLSCIVEDRLC